VLESLLCDTPVIGTRGSSIDEIVVDEVNGRLVEPRNVRELAAAMCAAWQCGFALRTDLARASPLWPDLQPPTAVRHLVAFVEHARERSRP
jgi:glycosyltransferase involved in cell wall biosynthesis